MCPYQPSQLVVHRSGTRPSRSQNHSPAAEAAHGGAQARIKGFLAAQPISIKPDGFVVRDAAKLAREHRLLGAVAAHLAMALRLDAD